MIRQRWQKLDNIFNESIRSFFHFIFFFLEISGFVVSLRRCQTLPIKSTGEPPPKKKHHSLLFSSQTANLKKKQNKSFIFFFKFLSFIHSPFSLASKKKEEKAERKRSLLSLLLLLLLLLMLLLLLLLLLLLFAGFSLSFLLLLCPYRDSHKSAPPRAAILTVTSSFSAADRAKFYFYFYFFLGIFIFYWDSIDCRVSIGWFVDFYRVLPSFNEFRYVRGYCQVFLMADFYRISPC